MVKGVFMDFKKYFKEVLLCVNIVLILGLYVLISYQMFWQPNNDLNTQVNIDNTQTTENSPNTSSKNIYVEVKGAVSNPDVYQISENSILKDVITSAGGFANNAYTNNLNLSKKLQDQMVIYVYSKYEYSQLNKPVNSNSYSTCVCDTVDISPCLNTGQSVIEQSSSSASNNTNTNVSVNSSSSESSKASNEEDIKTNDLININTASATELTTLSGIGESKANNIIAYREEHGYFTSIEDIKNVSGISDNIYAKIKDYITI